MYILHIETSTKICSVALSRGDTLLGYLYHNEGMNHTAILTPCIQQLLKSSAIHPSDLGAIAVSSGPGSYTGLRVGSSTAKAIAYSLNIPIVAVPTLSALAAAAFERYPQADLALPMLDARRNEVYTSLYDKGMNQIISIASVILEGHAINDFIPDGKTIVCCGDGAQKLNDLSLNHPNLKVDLEIQSSAIHMIGLAFKLLSTGDYSDPMHFVPYYLKPPNITQPRKLF